MRAEDSYPHFLGVRSIQLTPHVEPRVFFSPVLFSIGLFFMAICRQSLLLLLNSLPLLSHCCVTMQASDCDNHLQCNAMLRMPLLKIPFPPVLPIWLATAFRQLRQFKWYDQIIWQCLSVFANGCVWMHSYMWSLIP